MRPGFDRGPRRTVESGPSPEELRAQLLAERAEKFPEIHELATRFEQAMASNQAMLDELQSQPRSIEEAREAVVERLSDWATNLIPMVKELKAIAQDMAHLTITGFFEQAPELPGEGEQYRPTELKDVQRALAAWWTFSEAAESQGRGDELAELQRAVAAAGHALDEKFRTLDPASAAHVLELQTRLRELTDHGA